MTTAGGEQKRAKRKPSEEESTAEAPPKTESKDTAEVDKLLDEIDEVLEENAEEFVRSYIQKGGE
jgi:ubiquitin-like protein Pup